MDIVIGESHNESFTPFSNVAEEVTEPGIVTNGGLRTDAAVRTTILLSFITAGLLVLHSATPGM